MSAANIFTQGDAAYLMTDGARFEPDGTVAEIGSKVVTCPRLRIALGFTGHYHARQFDLWLQKIKTQYIFITELAGLAMSAREYWHARSGEKLPPEFQIFVALHNGDEPQLYVYSTNDGGGGYRPGLSRVRAFVVPNHAGSVLPSAGDLLDPSRFDIERDAVPMLEEQRRVPWPDGRHLVGGLIELTRVDRDGVTKRVLHRWDDKVGTKIRV